MDNTNSGTFEDYYSIYTEQELLSFLRFRNPKKYPSEITDIIKSWFLIKKETLLVELAAWQSKMEANCETI